MTPLEIVERIEAIWHVRPHEIKRYMRTPFTAERFEILLPGDRSLHVLDDNGHAICHEQCAEWEDAGGKPA